MKKSFVVYFGTTLNETCEYADLIIPSSSFLSKKDVRLSYGHEFKAISQIVKQKDENSISEYDLTNYLLEKFDLEKLKLEDEIISYYENHKPLIPSLEKFDFIPSNVTLDETLNVRLRIIPFLLSFLFG